MDSMSNRPVDTQNRWFHGRQSEDDHRRLFGRSTYTRSCYRNARTASVVFLFVSLLGTATHGRPLSPSPHTNACSTAESVAIVESMDKGSAAERSGMVAGDIIREWKRGESSGQVTSPFDVILLQVEQAPRGAVTLLGERGGNPFSWTLSSESWGLKARPLLEDAALDAYAKGSFFATTGKVADAAMQWEQLATKDASLCELAPSWLLFHAATLLNEAHLRKESADFYGKAYESASEASAPVRSLILERWADPLNQMGEIESARQKLEMALAEIDTAEPQGLFAASLSLGIGTFEFYQGDYIEADRQLRRSLELRQGLAPESMSFAKSLNNVALISLNQGDYTAAQRYFERALAIKQRLAPGDYSTGTTLLNLGLIARFRVEIDLAFAYHKRALKLYEQLGSAGETGVAGSLNDLGEDAADSDNLTEALDFYRRSLKLKEAYSASGLDLEVTVANMADAFRKQGNLEAAEQYYRRALEIVERFTPAGPSAALLENQLGEMARLRNDLPAAEQRYRLVVARWEKLSPEGSSYAEALGSLAEVLRDEGHLAAAGPFFQRAIDVLEAQYSHLGGFPDARSGFRARYSDYYADYVDLLMGSKQTEKAFTTWESSRARTLSEMLVETHVDIRKGIDPAVLQRERLLKAMLDSESDRRIELRQTTNVQEKLSAINKEMDNLLAQYHELEDQIRAATPAYAALHTPQPLGLNDIQRQLLDPDTLLLEYSLGKQHSYVFAVSQDSVAAFQLPPRSDIEGLSQQVYELLTARNQIEDNESDAARQTRIAAAGARCHYAVVQLSHMVLGPVAPLLVGKRRLVIVTDGALQYIPFGALVLPTSLTSASPPRMVTQYEIVMLPSASVLGELRREDQQRALASKLVAVLADPVFDAEDQRVTHGYLNVARRYPGNQTNNGNGFANSASADVGSRLTRAVSDVSAASRTFHLQRLAFTRQEAATIVATVPPGRSMEALDFRASRATASSPDLAQYRIVHFATHALLDNNHPELSGLVLSLVDQRGRAMDGFLTLEDIYNLNLNADLVVLSACETALGKEIKGEGLVGLTRGFMYAGTPRVVASLWKVDDMATADLMRLFYKFMLQQHLAPAPALRAAQLRMSEQKRWSDPYYWAGFIIQGDWR